MSPQEMGRDQPDLTEIHAHLEDTIDRDQLERDRASLGEWISEQGLDISAEVEERYQKWLSDFDVQTEFEREQLRSLVTESIRIHRCYDEEFARTARDAARARLSWEEDRAAEIHAIVGKLHRNPERWRAALLRTAQGCRWMVDQWRGLARLINEGKTLDARQRSRALDLLGVPPLFREASTPLDPPRNAEPDYLARRIEQEIEQLTARIEQVHEPLEAIERQHTELGLTISFEKDMMALRRFEAGCHRRFQQLLKALRRKTPTAATSPPKRDTTSHRPLFTSQIPSSFGNPYLSSILRNETERCSVLLADEEDDEPGMTSPLPSAVATAPSPSIAREPLFRGNRKQRRRAEALARRRS